MKTHKVPYHVSTVNTTDKLPEKEWNELAGDNIFAYYGWLRTLEHTLIEPISPLYVLIRDSNRLLGGAACYIQRRHDALLGVDDALLGRLKHTFPRFGLSFRPALVCALRHAAHCPVMIRNDLAPQERQTIRELLLNNIEKCACSYGVSTAFSTTAEDTELNQALQRRGYTQAIDIPTTYLDVEWEDFSGYLSYLKKVRRNKAKSVKREINKNRRSGVRIQDVNGLNGLEEPLMRLFKLNHCKYNQEPFLYKDSFLYELKKNLSEKAVIKMATKESRPIGASLMLTSGAVNSLMLLGIDHALSGDDLTYFNLNIYEQITHAISSGSKRIYFGRAAYDLKIRRGCKVIDTYTYFKPTGLRHRIMTRLWFPVLSAWVKAKLPDWIRRNHETDYKCS